MKSKYFFLISSLMLVIVAFGIAFYLRTTKDVAPEDSDASSINIASTPPIIDGVYALNERHPDAVYGWLIPATIVLLIWQDRILKE